MPMGSVPTTDLLEACKLLEQDLEDLTGWDEAGPIVWMFGVSATHTWFFSLRQPNPADLARDIRLIAALLDQHADAREAFRAMLPDGITIVGGGVSMESWSLDKDAPPEEYERIAVRKEIMIADSVWGHESRAVIALDGTGTWHMAQRIRGQEPTAYRSNLIGGSIGKALAVFVPVLVSALAPATSP